MQQFVSGKNLLECFCHWVELPNRQESLLDGLYPTTLLNNVIRFYHQWLWDPGQGVSTSSFLSALDLFQFLLPPAKQIVKGFFIFAAFWKDLVEFMRQLVAFIRHLCGIFTGLVAFMRLIMKLLGGQNGLLWSWLMHLFSAAMHSKSILIRKKVSFSKINESRSDLLIIWTQIYLCLKCSTLDLLKAKIPNLFVAFYKVPQLA